jgi:hypothetical protein
LIIIFKDENDKIFQVINEHRPRKTRSTRKKKRSSQHNGSFDTATTTSANPEGRHFHLDMNTVPFILGASTAPSHNVKSNVQNVRPQINTKEKTSFFSSLD